MFLMLEVCWALGSVGFNKFGKNLAINYLNIFSVPTSMNFRRVDISLLAVLPQVTNAFLSLSLFCKWLYVFYVCFLLESFHCCVFKFLNLFLCVASSAVKTIQVCFSSQTLSFSSRVSVVSLFNVLYLSWACGIQLWLVISSCPYSIIHVLSGSLSMNWFLIVGHLLLLLCIAVNFLWDFYRGYFCIPINILELYSRVQLFRNSSTLSGQPFIALLDQQEQHLV